MNDHVFELSVGDVFRIGDYLVTLVDVEGEEAGFRIEPAEEGNEAVSGVHRESLHSPR